MTEDLRLDREQQREFKRQWAEISRGAVDMLPEEEFRAKLERSIASGTPLRVKQGFDPTSADIHIGHTVGLRKLKQFQDLGHTIVLIVGDYTALVGDPSDRSSTRPVIGYDEILKNAQTYQDQFFRVLDRSKTEVRSNGEWFKNLGFNEVMHLAGKFTVARLLERDDFSKRLKAGSPISVHELFYPLMQAYDSVAIRADVEIGGTDQTFNLLAGRTIQDAYGVDPQVILTMPLLVGLDGVKKMSKSLGNYIGVDEPAREIFGKAMSIPDSLIYSYFELATDVSLEELAAFREQLDDPKVNPMVLKKKLAERLVDMYHPAGSGADARAEFERIFSRGQLPDEIPRMTAVEVRQLGLDPERIFLVGLMTKAGLSKSNGEARKLIAGGGVSINGERVGDPDHEFALTGEQILKVGKRRFLKLVRG